MYLRSIKSKLFIAVLLLTVGSILPLSILFTHRYTGSLLDAEAAQAENITHAITLEATEKILTNDLVSLQKLLDHHVRSNSAIVYLFVQQHEQVLAHTFEKGFPEGLLAANDVPGNEVHLQSIASQQGERFLDIAWPIFDGKGGTLRLGFSEQPYREQITRLWIQLGWFTLVILFLAVGGSLYLLQKITKPLAILAEAAEKIDEGNLNVKVEVHSDDEVGRLTVSFNHMLARLHEYTARLEEQARSLERAYQQTRTSCGIVQEIGAMRTLKEAGLFLIGKCQHILKCKHIVLIVMSEARNTLFAFSSNGVEMIREEGIFKNAEMFLRNNERLSFFNTPIFSAPCIPPEYLKETKRQAVVPLHFEGRLFGALVMSCPGQCSCNLKEVELIGLIVNQACAVMRRALLQEEEFSELQSRLAGLSEFSGIVGKDPKMQVIYKMIEDIAPTDATVLIQGESGTGKEVVARAIHQKSLRSNEPFMVINCSAYPATLLESELFGHEKGAFTGAVRRKPGRFEQADGGTVFLDEIGEISPSAQIKLLRVLQTKKFERLGGEQSIAVDVRILAATNKNLLEEVKEGRFREDLFYRLNVIPILLPPLRERRNDIPLLARHFLRQFASILGKAIDDFSTDAMRLLLNHSWPGNVRELENSVEYSVTLAKGGLIEVTDLQPLMIENSVIQPGSREKTPTMVESEKELLLTVLQGCGWNKKLAAQRLGISRNTLYIKIKKYQLTKFSLN